MSSIFPDQGLGWNEPLHPFSLHPPSATTQSSPLPNHPSPFYLLHLFMPPPTHSSEEGNGNPLQYSCLENPMDGGAWQAAVHGVTKSQTWLSNFIFTFYFHALEKEMATHSIVLAWRIPGMAEPGGLLSMGLHRVGHNWRDLAAAAAPTHHPFSDPPTEWPSSFQSTLLFIHLSAQPPICPSLWVASNQPFIQLHCFQSLDSFMPSKTRLPHIHSPIYPSSLLHAGSMPGSVATEISMSCFSLNPDKVISVQWKGAFMK